MEGTLIFFLLLVQQKVKKSEVSHINKDSSPLSALMLFFTEIFHLLVEQTNLYYQQHLDGQAGPVHQLPDSTLWDMMTFIALALQMGHGFKDTLRDYYLQAVHSKEKKMFRHQNLQTPYLIRVYV